MNEEKRKEREEEFKNKASIIHEGKYGYNNVYFINKTTKVDILCPIHGIFSQTPKNHLKGQGCPICGKEYAKTFRKNNYVHFLNITNERFGDLFCYPNIRDEYENSHSIITIKCKRCGNLFHKIACDHITSKDGGCIQCRNGRRIQSKMEKNLCNLLDNNNITYVREKTFTWLKHKINLYLDFYLTDYHIAFECQGRQHYEPVDFAGRGKEWALQEFKIIKERDKTKQKLCKEHNLPIMYINNANYDENYILNGINKNNFSIK